MPTAVDRRAAIAQVADTSAQPRTSTPGSTATPRPVTPAGAAPGGTTTPAALGNAAAPGMTGANDPTYLAYMRQMGVEEAGLNALLGHRVGALTRELGRGLPAYAEQRERAIRDTGFGYEDKGMYRSGTRIAGQQEAARDVDRERMDWEAGIRDQIAELGLMNAMDVAALRRQLLEQGFSSVQATAIANAQAGL